MLLTLALVSLGIALAASLTALVAVVALVKRSRVEIRCANCGRTRRDVVRPIRPGIRSVGPA